MDAHFNLNHCIELRRIGVKMINVALKGIPLKQSSSDIRGAWETGSWPFEEKLSSLSQEPINMEYIQKAWC